MIEGLFEREFIITRQREAPLLKEREMYLSYLLAQGTSRHHVRVIASRLLHINCLLGMSVLRSVGIEELQHATQLWVHHIESHNTREIGLSTAYTFSNTAEKWLRFHNLLTEPSVYRHPYEGIFADFMQFITVTRQMSLDSVHNYHAKVSLFLRWAGKRRNQISEITLNDIDEYLESKRSSGMKPRSIASHCHSLRTFFRYVEAQGASERIVSNGIKSPAIHGFDILPKGPRWSDVRRMLKPVSNETPAELRTRAILFLCSIYALRGIEIRGLKIDDFNWVSETFSVQRAKRGSIQEFPIQFEVGEAIIRYLRYARPSCDSRLLFVTLKPPYRAMNQSVLARIVGRRMKCLNIKTAQYGPHALRHACATHLLKMGSSLIAIADFLGHRDIKSVGIYAKLDTRMLRKVALFNLAGVK